MKEHKTDYERNGDMKEKIWTAALLVIGDEILSGRTQDANIQYLATWLNDEGVRLSEVRVVPDVTDSIVHAVNALRTKFDYLFTTGGIGPTHDDITAEAIAIAFRRPLIEHPEAIARLGKYYTTEKEFTPARRRMTRVPEGGSLIDNSISIAPGFRVENTFVMAGIPKVMQAMLSSLKGQIKGGKPQISRSVTFQTVESGIAGPLEDIQNLYDGISLGSYPFLKNKKPHVQIVIRGTNKMLVDKVERAVSGLGTPLDESD